MKLLNLVIFIILNCAPVIYSNSKGMEKIISRSGKEKFFPKDSIFLGFEKEFSFDLTELQKFRNPRSLEILSLELGSIDLKNIPSWSNLEHLNFEGTNIDTLDELNIFPNLRILNLNKTKINKIDSILRFKSITQLSLVKTNISTLKNLCKLIELRRLDIRETKIDSIEELKNCKKLNELYIGKTNIKDIKPLYGKKELIYLEIDNLELGQQISEIRTFNPYLKIIYRGR
ncbi:MAG: hypothetical protein SFU98_19590 [Leptospiraceae bacterium]|nr:hypothetical protein [Leptospiraceae bacterium]